MLQNTQVSNIPQNAFQGLSNLQAISIQKNPLASIAGNAFQGLTKLQELYLNRNNLTHVSRDSFKGITALTAIDISRNNLDSLPDSLFADTVNLNFLYLNYNKITTISATLLKNLGSLGFLRLSNNKISNISGGAFSSLSSSLRHLNLDYNRLSDFPVEPLKNFADVNDSTELRLAYNDFYTIPLEAKPIFDRIAARLGGIWIANNPLVCTKELQWFQTWMKTNPAVVRDLDEVTCLTPYGNWSKVFDFDFGVLGKKSTIF